METATIALRLWRCFDFPDWCEDYCYFNNTDRPEGITAREWSSRGKKWDKLCLCNHNEKRFSHVVIEMSARSNIGGEEIVKRIFGEEVCKSWKSSPLYEAIFNYQDEERKSPGKAKKNLEEWI